MEHTTKFDLSQNIQEWKTVLANSGNISEENIYELECHLLDEIEKLQIKDLSQEESFYIAQKRLGTIENLNREYRKLNHNVISWKKLELVLKGILLLFVFMAGAQFFSNLSLMLGTFLSLNSTKIVIINAVSLVLIIAMSIYSFYQFTSAKGHMLKKFTSIPLLIGGVVVLNLINVYYQQTIYRQTDSHILAYVFESNYVFKIICGVVLVVISYWVHVKIRARIDPEITTK